MQDEINTNVRELLDYVDSNPRLFRVSYNHDLIKINYSKECEYKKKWNEFTLITRGIMINSAALEIVALPFLKFFNEFEYEQMNVGIPTSEKYWITEKLDGILIIPYTTDNDLKFSTRGSFDNEYVRKANEVAYFDYLPVDKYTFMFELVSPEYSGHLVTRYDNDDLVLIGMRDNATLRLLSPPEVVDFARKNDLHHYALYDDSLDKIKSVLNNIEGNTLEGWVVFFESGFLMKLKRLEYINLFRIYKKLNEKTVLKLLIENNFHDFLVMSDEEVRATLLSIKNSLDDHAERFISFIKDVFYAIPQEIRADRKSFFLYIGKKNYSRIIKLFLKKFYVNGNESDLKKMYYRVRLSKKSVYIK